MEIIDKIVDFEKYCKICKYKDCPEKDMPCSDCLEYPMNQNSQRPVQFKEAEEKEQKKKIQEERKLLQPKSRMRLFSRKSNTAVVDSERVGQ